jgi:predicted alpha/beta superfamily hydrolase
MIRVRKPTGTVSLKLKKQRFIVWLGLVGTSLVLPPACHVQPTGEPVVIGEKLEIESKLLGEQRPLMIAKPNGYDSGNERYPVVYLLDGGPQNFRHTTGIVSFLDFADRAPGMLLVAITNTNRSRDLTPPTQSEHELRRFTNHGGADRFLQFIRDELMPWVNQNYRTRPYTILVGHSLGGLLALHALTTRPEMFDAYVAVDPSMQWNDQAIVGQADTFLAQTAQLNADLYLTMTAEEGPAAGGLKKLVGILEEKAPLGFRWTLRRMPGETHLSTLHRSIYLGLDTIFDGWHLTDPLDLYNEGGVAAVHKHFEERGKRYGYERKTAPFTVSTIVYKLIEAGRLDEAHAVLFHDRDRYPPHWNQLEALARAHSERGDNERAIDYYKLTLKENPQNEHAKTTLRELGGVATPTPAPETRQ